jgi:hydrogenase maturation protease
MGDLRPDSREREFVIIGVGNEFRQDDGAGIAVARRLKLLNKTSARIIEQGGEGTELLDCFQDAESVIIIDATSTGDTPGTVHRFKVTTNKLPHGLARSSSHSFGVAEAIEMARILGQLPTVCIVYGIEGKWFNYGTELSPEVALAIEHVSHELLEHFECHRPQRTIQNIDNCERIH